MNKLINMYIYFDKDRTGNDTDAQKGCVYQEQFLLMVYVTII